MKNIKKMMIIIAIIILIILVLIIFFKTQRPNKVVNILIEKSYENHSWGLDYKGCVICEDGCVYTFEYDSKENYNANSLIERNDSIKKHIKKKIGKLSKNELDIIKEIIQNNRILEKNKTERKLIPGKDVPFDFGSTNTRIYDYKKQKLINLESYSNNDDTDTILNIINNYYYSEK